MRVLPGGMAEAAGVEAGDTLVTLEGFPVRTPAELQVALRSAARAPLVTLRFDRAGATMERRMPAIHVRTEDGVRYLAIERDGVRLRAMLDASTRPGRGPAILFVQGLTLASMDFAYPELWRAFRDEGVVTMRLDKRGVGDSEGEAPERGDLMTEVGDVSAALDALRAEEHVDPAAVFLFGHSVGGMILPLLPGGDRARGAIVYGSSAEPWRDCVEAGALRQSTLRGEADVEARVHAARQELLTQPIIDGRSRAYHDQLHDAAIAEAWSRTRWPVLVLHGDYDWVVGRDEAERIAQLARGAFRPIPRLDHLFSAHDSLEGSLNAYGKGRFERAIVMETCAWMRDLSRVPSG